MNFNAEELKRILKWFKLSERKLEDEDLFLYEDIKENLNDLGYDDDDIPDEDIIYLDEYEEDSEDD
jgi:hypothetical protein